MLNVGDNVLEGGAINDGVDKVGGVSHTAHGEALSGGHQLLLHLRPNVAWHVHARGGAALLASVPGRGRTGEVSKTNSLEGLIVCVVWPLLEGASHGAVDNSVDICTLVDEVEVLATCLTHNARVGLVVLQVVGNLAVDGVEGAVVQIHTSC